MKLKPTKVLAKFLNDNLPNDSSIDSIGVFTMTPNYFELNVDSNWLDHENDYDIATNKYKVLCVSYKYDCYACARYITTNDLNRLVRNQSPITADSFLASFFDAYEI